jgi:hypothetical protein
VGGDKAFFGETVANTCLFQSVEMQFRTNASDVALEWFTCLIRIHELPGAVHGPQNGYY